MRRYADILRDGRLAAGIGLGSAARMLGVSPQYLSQVESGTRLPFDEGRSLEVARIFQLHPVVVLAAAVQTKWPRLIREIEPMLVDLPERIPDDGQRREAWP